MINSSSLEMIGGILLPAPAQLLSHRLSLWNRRPRPGPRCSLSKQGHRFLSTLIATDSDDISATRHLLRKFVGSSSKHVALSTLSHLVSPTTTSHYRLCSLALPVRLSVIMYFSLSSIHCEAECLFLQICFTFFPTNWSPLSMTQCEANCLF